MNLKWRLGYRDDRLDEARIEFEFDFANELRDVFTITSTNVAAPCVHLVLRHLFTAEDGICA